MGRSTVGIILALVSTSYGFSTVTPSQNGLRTSIPCRSAICLAATGAATVTGGFIETELRGQAMKLHTRSQSPKEGQATEEKQAERYTPTYEDYLKFLADSQNIFQAFEDVVNELDELAVFRDTGLERVVGLEKDIEFMVSEYNVERPAVGNPGLSYAEEIRAFGKEKKTPEFMCHFYNYYFAHTAGGRMIGKQMSALLLDKKTLEFYKWDGDLNAIKTKVKDDIEEMVSHWSREEKDSCVNETAGAFRGGGAVNGYLSGGGSPH